MRIRFQFQRPSPAPGLAELALTILLFAPAGAQAATPAFGPQQVITIEAEGANSVFAADLDGDGDLDVLSASVDDDKVAWHENMDGAGAFGPRRIITINLTFVQSVTTADLDGDGDEDVLTDSYWQENTDGMGAFGAEQRLSADNSFLSNSPTDIDGDGDIDLLATYRPFGIRRGYRVGWFRNMNGLGLFDVPVLFETPPVNVVVRAADLDGDGDQDAVLALTGRHFSEPEINWRGNTDGMGAFGPELVIEDLGEGVNSFIIADLDGDGDQDILSASGPVNIDVAWHENTDGKGAFAPSQVFSQITGGPASVLAADFDRDGDMDALVANASDDTLVWHENTDGSGAFGSARAITTLIDNPRAICVADLDGDGDPDILTASRGDNKIAWYENLSRVNAVSVQAWRLYD